MTRAGAPALEAREVRCEIGRAVAVRAERLTVARGEVVALVGPNGAGKTTLLRGLVGLLHTTGTIEIAGEAVTAGHVPASVGAYIGSPSAPSWLSPDAFARTLVDSAGMPGARRRAAAALEEVGLEPAARRRRFTRLSQGQRAIALVACTLLRDPELIVLDEPFAHLDVHRAARLERVIAGRAARGAGVLFACHHRGDLAAADRVVAIDDQRLHGSWDPGDQAIDPWVR